MEMHRLDYCWVRSCPNYRLCNKNVELYPPPNDYDERSLWGAAFGLTTQEIANPAARICGNHFRRKYFLPSSQIPGLANQVTPPASPQVSPCIVRAYPANQNLHQVKEVSIVTPPPVSNSVNDQSSKKTPAFSISTTYDSCELFCQEESLTPIQERFQYEEWLNYVKYTTKIDQLPFVTAVTGSEAGEVATSQQPLPLLVYSNVTQQPQTVLASSVPGPVPQTQLLTQSAPGSVPQTPSATGPVPQAQIFIPSVPGSVPQVQLFAPPVAGSVPQVPAFTPTVNGPGPQAQAFTPSVPGSISQAQVFTTFLPSSFTFSTTNSVANNQVSQVINPLITVAKSTSSIINNSSLSNIPSGLPIQSSVFPVRLERNVKPLVDTSSASQNSEEVFPLFAQEPSFARLLNHQQESVPLEQNVVVDSSVASPSPSVSSGNDRCLSPDLLCNVEFNFNFGINPMELEQLIQDVEGDDEWHNVFPKWSEPSPQNAPANQEESSNNVCDLCGKTYSSKGNLLNHRKKHTGERIFKCNLCGKSFASKYNVKRHLHRTTHPIQESVSTQSVTLQRDPVQCEPGLSTSVEHGPGLSIPVRDLPVQREPGLSTSVEHESGLSIPVCDLPVQREPGLSTSVEHESGLSIPVHDLPVQREPGLSMSVEHEPGLSTSVEHEPAPSVSSQNQNITSNVDFEEIEDESLPSSLSENTPALLGSDNESDNSNGPKIVDVCCGDAVVKEFYDGLVPFVKEGNSDQQKVYFTTIDGTMPSGNSMPRTVTDWSIFSMQKTIAVISSGTVDPNIHNLLGVRIHIPPITSERDVPTRLKNSLRSENFLTLAPWWMVQKGYLPLNPPCSSCGSKFFHLNSCPEYLDNLCWVCDNPRCLAKYPVKRPKFFERFPSFTLEELLLLTYHWACKSRIWVINHDVPVHEERVWEYFNALQELCGQSVSQNRFIGMSDKNMLTVEVSAVKLGNFFILCAFDRRSKVSRLKVLTTEEACNSLKHIECLTEWLGDFCRVVTWKQISDNFLPNVVKLGADPTIGHIQSPGRHILNASKYLGKTAVTLFQNICHAKLTVDTVQRVLDEVQWRERHGKNEELAFWNILFEIASSNASGETTATLGEFSKDRYFYKSDMPFRLRWGPFESAVKSYGQPASNLSANNKIIEKGTTQLAILTNNKNLEKGITQPASKLLINNKNLEKGTTIRTVTKKPADPSQQGFTKNMYLSADQIITIPTAVMPSTAVASKNNSAEDKNHPISVPPVPTNSVRERMTEMPISAKDFLTIKIFFYTDDSHLNDYRLQARKLGLLLKEEGYLKNPVWWLVKKCYIRDKSTCYVCQGMAKLRVNAKFADGVSWVCQKANCRFENKYQRPAFFALNFKLEVIFSVIYHWAVQSDYDTLMKAVPVNEFNIVSIHRKLQNVCAEIKKRDSFKIGGKKSLVEIAFVRIASSFILGAMERSTCHSRFRTFSSDTKLHIEAVRETLVSWLCPESIVIVNSNKYLGRYSLEEKIHIVFADKTVTDVNSTKYHTLTITNYLQNHIKTMFQSVNVQNMSAELLQMYLDELMWRERYGKGPTDAFYSIFSCIFAVEYKDPNFKGGLKDSVLIKNAASYYGFSLPLPELRVELVKLPDHLVHQYTTQGKTTPSRTIPSKTTPSKTTLGKTTLGNTTPCYSPQRNSLQAGSSQGCDEITIIDDFVRKNCVSEEIILDDDVEILPSPSVINPASSSTSPSSASKGIAPMSLASIATKPIASTSKASTPIASTSNALTPIATTPIIASIPIVSTPIASISKTFVPIAPMPKASTSSVTALSPTKITIKKEKSFISVKTNRKMNRSHSYKKTLNDYNVYKRYSDKNYSRKRKARYYDGKTRCVECRDVISEDHFVKQYSCGDCKRFVYTTFCQRAFARHRSYILFGRKICSDAQYNKNTFLPQKWYCSCGYGSKDGNKLALHLVECQKSTCYLKTVDTYRAVTPIEYTAVTPTEPVCEEPEEPVCEEIIDVIS